MGHIACDEEKAIFLATVCSQTYAQYADPGGSFVLPQGYALRHVIYAASINAEWERFGFILESPEEILIAFRGTSSTSDWISDAIALQVRCPFLAKRTLTHRGFTAIYETARNEIRSALAGLPAEKAVTVTGHSLGAALATLCAADVAANSACSSPRLFTFGSPRVGDPAFADTVARLIPDSFRFANLFDIVTYAPPAVLQLPKSDIRYEYRHVPVLCSLAFQNGSFGLNHVIGRYYAELAKRNPRYALALQAENPGLCPEAGENTAATA
ncbi:lipase family protein [Gorillibacterium sp. sgz500922]|uniref:lipase family protein n=1 Tax=Gorillibacterium sp. sgz500922 TaxID=3446694 RepID=UPI003F67313D